MKNSLKFPLFGLLTIVLCAGASVASVATAKNLGEQNNNASSVAVTQTSRQVELASAHANLAEVDFSVPELGIKFKVPQSVANDLVYTVRTAKGLDGFPETIASFSTKSLTAAGTEGWCTAEDGPIGAIVKVTENAEIPKTDYVQFNGFTYYYLMPQAVCSEISDAVDLQGTQSGLLREAAKSIESL